MFLLEVTQAAASDNSVVMTHLTAAGFGVALINYLKKSPYFPWITKEKQNVLRAVAVITSAIGAIGVHYSWHPESRQLTFMIPTFAQALGFGVTWVKSFIAQETVYQATASKNGGPPAVVPAAPAAQPAKA